MDNLGEPSIHMGTHSPSLSSPLIQMGGLTHPFDIAHQSRGVDVSTALASLHTEVALLTSQVIVLRTALSVEIDQTIILRDSNIQHLSSITHALTGFASGMDVRLKELDDRLSILQHNTSNGLTALQRELTESQSQFTTLLLMLRSDIESIPKTYFWPRLKRWLGSLF